MASVCSTELAPLVRKLVRILEAWRAREASGHIHFLDNQCTNT